jgi:hypothetical protein
MKRVLCNHSWLDGARDHPKASSCGGGQVFISENNSIGRALLQAWSGCMADLGGLFGCLLLKFPAFGMVYHY